MDGWDGITVEELEDGITDNDIDTQGEVENSAEGTDPTFVRVG